MDTRNFDREKVLTILIPKEAATPSFSPLRDILRLRFTRLSKQADAYLSGIRSIVEKQSMEGGTIAIALATRKKGRKRERRRERKKDNKRLASRFPPPSGSPRVRAYASRTRVNERRRNSAETSNLDLSIHAFLET